MESLFKYCPLKLNPIYAIGMQLTMVYVPIFMKKPLVSSMLRKQGKTLDIANSRAQSNELLSANSPESQYLATLTGCHLNNFEALIYFSAATLAGLAVASNNNNDKGMSYEVVEGFAGFFIAIRSAYTVIYLTPSLNGVLRSIAFGLGIASSTAMLFIAGSHYSALKTIKQ